jgi:protein-tyrosine kinase
MERIKEAVERAKRERAQGTGFAAPMTRHQETTAPAINYTQTPTVEMATAQLREKRVIAAVEDSMFNEAYRMLRTQVLQRLRENNWNVLAVTSASKGEGKTLTAVNLAISLAKEVDQTVLLIDADLRNPTVHEYLGLRQEPGLGNFLTGGSTVELMLLHPDVGRLVVVPGGKPLDNSAGMLSSPKMHDLVREVKSRYIERIVIFDLPPVLATADVLAFAPFVDAVLLVVEEGKTSKEELQRAAELLGNIPIMGTVLNKSQWSDAAVAAGKYGHPAADA